MKYGCTARYRRGTRAIAGASPLARPTAVSSLFVACAFAAPTAAAQGAAVAPTQNCPVGGTITAGCYGRADDRVGPPPVPLPPECDYQKLKECMGSIFCNLKLAFSPQECTINKELCEALPDREVLHTDSGDVCVPKGPKKCPQVKLFSRETSNDDCTSYPIRKTTSLDPNDKYGPPGIGAQQFLLNGVPTLSYQIRFENLDTAGAAAQEVVIADALDGTVLDLDTFSLGPIGFGNVSLVPSPGVQEYTGGVDLRPGKSLIVLVDARLDRATGIATWRYTSVDPATLQLTEDPEAGFLPPNAAPPEGEGSVVFTVATRAALASGTVIRNKASIVFDANAAIATPTWVNTIDKDVPVTHVLPLVATVSTPTFAVQWAGSDAGSGVFAYTVYVSDNGGAFTPWIERTTATSATFTAQIGHSYRFFSLGEDRVGNVEPMKSIAEATTLVVPVALQGAMSRRLHGAAGTFDLALSLVTSTPTTEPRSGGAGGNYSIVFVFDKAVTGGTASVTAGTGTAGTPSFNGNEMVVPLSGVANQQYVTVGVSDVIAADGATGGSASVRIGFLLGDVSGNRVVTVADLAQVNAQIAQPVSAANYLKDINASGTLTVADKGIANTQITRALPAP